MRTTLLKLLAPVMAAGIAAAACGGTPAASNAPTTSAAASAPLGQLPVPELTKVRIGISTPVTAVDEDDPEVAAWNARLAALNAATAAMDSRKR